MFCLYFKQQTRSTHTMLSYTHVFSEAGVYNIYTKQSTQLADNLLLPLSPFYQFYVTACESAIVTMARDPFDLDRDAFSLEIGVNGNTQTKLFHQVSIGVDQYSSKLVIY